MFRQQGRDQGMQTSRLSLVEDAWLHVCTQTMNACADYSAPEFLISGLPLAVKAEVLIAVRTYLCRCAWRIQLCFIHTRLKLISGVLASHFVAWDSLTVLFQHCRWANNSCQPYYCTGRRYQANMVLAHECTQVRLHGAVLNHMDVSLGFSVGSG